MKKKKRLLALLVTVILLLPLVGCSGQTAKSPQKQRETVMVYCWSEHMIYSGYAAYVQSKFPDVDVVFVTGTNSMAYYEFMEKNGGLPDILTVRRMSMIDAENLRDHLLDLSETEAAAGFNNVYLENYRFDDGSINWLPACGEVDGYIANLDLFEKYQIEIPTDRESFDAACEAFKKVGIMPYSNDFGRDYTCLETLQGLSIQELMTGEAIEWRTGYESGVNRQLDETVWLPAFERLERQLKVWETPTEAAQYGYAEMAEPFLNGEAAFMRGTGNDVIDFIRDRGMKVGILPYFGDTEDDNWLLTYPSFNVAVNKKVSEDPEKEKICLQVLEEMFSEGAQNILAGNHNMIPYNTGVSLDLDKSMKNLEPYISKNQLYLRLASTEIFSASLESVTRMVTGEYTAKEAFDAFNKVLAEGTPESDEVAIHFDKSYENVFDPGKGNEAASVMSNTLREYFGSDLLIAHGVSYSGIIYEADYTQKQLKYMITDTTIHNYTRKLTGAQIKEFLEILMTKEYGGIAAINRYFLPVLSGFEMKVTEDGDGYHLEEVTVHGKEMKDEDSYTLTYLGSVYQAEPMLKDIFQEDGGYDAWERTDDCTVQDHWLNCMMGTDGKEPIKLAEPTAYLQLEEK